MKKQRDTVNLGKNQAVRQEEVYLDLESKGIFLKKCSRSSKVPHKKYGFVHEGPNPLAIREFNLQTSSKDGLQPNCKSCERKFRRGRIIRNSLVYANMTELEIYENYKHKYGVNIKKCGKCLREKDPKEFPLSRTMESGLHNQCRECTSTYIESLGERWVRFNPDGHTVHKRKANDKCVNCGNTSNLHNDHKWPVAKGGTDHKENFQILCQKCNNEKKTDVSEFSSISQIGYKMICERYHNQLTMAKEQNLPIRDFEILMSSEVRKFIQRKCMMTTNELRDFYTSEKQRNNRKFNVVRAVLKFKSYCRTQDFSSEVRT